MFIFFAYICFFASSTMLILWGLKAKANYLQFPFLMGLMYVFYLLWQSTGLLFHATDIPEEGFIDSLFMLSLCSTCCLVGYITGNSTTFRVPPIDISSRKIFYSGVFCLIIAIGGYMQLSRSMGGYLSFFSIGGGYDLVWQGDVVKHMFLINFCFPAIVFLLFSHCKLSKPTTLCLVICATIIPLAFVLFLGRRSVLAQLVVIVFVSLYFYKQILIPRRFVFIIVCVVVPLIIIVAPIYRQYSQLGAEHKDIFEIKMSEVLLDSFGSDNIDAMKNGSYVVGAYGDTLNFRYGIIFVDRFVMNFVPASIVGRDTKDKLLIGHGIEGIDDATTKVYPEFIRRPNEFYGGFAELYHEFWYFGCFYYFFLGKLFKLLWLRSTRLKCAASQFFYCLLILPAVSSVGNSPSNSLVNGIMIILMVLPFIYYAKLSKHAIIQKDFK